MVELPRVWQKCASCDVRGRGRSRSAPGHRLLGQAVPDLLGLGVAQPQLAVPQQEEQEVQPLGHLGRKFSRMLGRM